MRSAQTAASRAAVPRVSSRNRVGSPCYATRFLRIPTTSASESSRWERATKIAVVVRRGRADLRSAARRTRAIASSPPRHARGHPCRHHRASSSRAHGRHRPGRGLSGAGRGPADNRLSLRRSRAVDRRVRRNDGGSADNRVAVSRAVPVPAHRLGARHCLHVADRRAAGARLEPLDPLGAAVFHLQHHGACHSGRGVDQRCRADPAAGSLVDRLAVRPVPSGGARRDRRGRPVRVHHHLSDARGRTIAALVGVYQGVADLTFLSISVWSLIGRASGALADANASGALERRVGGRGAGTRRAIASPRGRPSCA